MAIRPLRVTQVLRSFSARASMPQGLSAINSTVCLKLIYFCYDHDVTIDRPIVAWIYIVLHKVNATHNSLLIYLCQCTRTSAARIHS